jgi:short-subunit dehydrogenase
MNNPVAVVAGVGPGIGLATAKRLAQEGYAVAMLARDTYALEELRQAVEQESGPVLALAAHTAEPSQIEQAFVDIRKHLGDPEVLVYNASLGHQIPPSLIKPSELLLEFQVNVMSALRCAQLVIPKMRQQGRGTILFTGGGSALEPNPKFPGLSIGKAGLRSLACSLASELKDDGIHVGTVTVCGFVQPGTRFAPDAVAQVLWELHAQPREAWQVEVVLQ